ncbi:hypothetical protein [Bradyrhizobium guangdongense]
MDRAQGRTRPAGPELGRYSGFTHSFGAKAAGTGRARLMSRGAHNFKQCDVTKAIKAAVKSGVKGWRVEIEGRKIVVLAGESERDKPQPGASEWD